MHKKLSHKIFPGFKDKRNMKTKFKYFAPSRIKSLLRFYGYRQP